MADSTPLLPQMAAAADDREIVFNGVVDALSPSSLYGRDYENCTGLVFAYIGGFFNGVEVANGDVTATASNTNYVVAHRTTGVVSISTATTNRDNTATYLYLWELVAGGSSITSYKDKRQVLGTTATVSRSPVIQTVASAATVTPTFSDDIVLITAQAAGLALANPTGGAIDGLGMVIRIKDDGTARAISYDTQYRAIGVTLPTTTVISKTMYLGMIFNNTDTKWDVLAVGEEL